MHVKRGFTIIELVVVIAIIAILAAIVMVNVVGYINKAKDAEVEADIVNISKDLVANYASNGSYTNYSTLATAPCGNQSYTINTNSNPAEFIVYHTLCANNTKYWCSDSNGVSQEINAQPSAFSCVPGESVVISGQSILLENLSQPVAGTLKYIGDY
jgi:prepilin-type N-terminal cleavage/methylation domain-containing protein